MGIDINILTWFDELASASAFVGCKSVLELGPQDCFFPIETFAEIAIRRLGPTEGAASTSRAFSAATSFPERRAAFYRPFGLDTYTSNDNYDDRADLRLDLNISDRPPQRFDVVVDCGTSEHVFNVGNVFVFTHNALKAGGLNLKVLPTFGDNTHGFYNIHPTVYFDVARVNGYEIVDFRYVENLAGRPKCNGVTSLLPSMDFAEGLMSFAGCAALQSKITRQFSDSIAQSTREGRIANAHATVDYCFVALRKVRDEPFQYPGQGVYLTEF